ncbi:ATP-binding protein [Kitasatospora sp. NPDC089797]|uniref:ATP-binding protein n=1 Tax=Kitasatospora sp. NPDC089797 TaxID=3155298 RepID=UPI0034247B97
MNTDLADLLGTRETACLEFKRQAKRPEQIRQAICSMANDLGGHGGGDLLIGVDDNGEPADDVDMSDRLLLALTDMRDDGKILERPSLTVTVAPFKGRPVIRIRVEASAATPVRLDGVIWVRPGPSTRKATRDDERVLSERRRAGDGPYDIRPLAGTGLEQLDLGLFRSTYLPAVAASDVLEENGRPEVQYLAASRFATLDGTATALGLLVVGYDPSAFIPGGYVQFVRYQGLDLDAPIVDEQELRHNVVVTADRLETILRGHLHTRIVEASGFREEQQPDYPIEALRELCMNAIMHRNYETSYAPVRIAWFEDRIEVTNPGGPYGQVRSDNFDRVNDYRNPSLAAAMKSLGYVNRFGRGIGRVRAALERNGNPPAEFLVDQSSWFVTVRRAQ